MCKAKGQSTDWVDEIAAKGNVWCTPGPYVRRSTLLLLSTRMAAIVAAIVAGTVTTTVTVTADRLVDNSERLDMNRQLVVDRPVLKTSPATI
jgi:hypothetical protein